MLSKVLQQRRLQAIRELEEGKERDAVRLARLENGTSSFTPEDFASLEEEKASINAAQALRLGQIARAKSFNNFVDGCFDCWIIDEVETVLVAARGGDDTLEYYTCTAIQRHSVGVPVGG